MAGRCPGTPSPQLDWTLSPGHGHKASPRRRAGCFRTYASPGRGDEAMGTTLRHLDITALRPSGRPGGTRRGLPQPPTYSVGDWHYTTDPRPAPDPNWVKCPTLIIRLPESATQMRKRARAKEQGTTWPPVEQPGPFQRIARGSAESATFLRSRTDTRFCAKSQSTDSRWWEGEKDACPWRVSAHMNCPGWPIGTDKSAARQQ